MTSARVIVALDVERHAQATQLVARLGASATFYKIGLQLLTSAGPSVVRELINAGKEVFLDLKLHEIPNSVAGAVAAAGGLGVSMVTVHASGGAAVLRAAVAAARPYPQLRVVALTVITSLRDAELAEVGIPDGVRAQVQRLARLASDAGCDGVVASPQEAAMLRGMLAADALIVTPGTQLQDESATDQARVATPAEAIAAGATHVVLGRSIVNAADPLAVFDSVTRSLSPRV